MRFETDITDHCNLNCAGCNHFSPLAEERCVDVDAFEKDFARLSELTKRKTENIDLMGGEPLLHPRLPELLVIARKYFDGTINIVTNGLLLTRMPDSFWKSCGDNNITVKVTSYPVRIDRHAIRQLAKKHKVRLKIRRQINNVHTWCRLPKDIQGRQDINENFKLCVVSNFCIFLRDGKLATCCLPLIADRFNKYFHQNMLRTAKNDYVDIYGVKNIGEILDFLCKPIPFCRYCKIKDWEVGVEWGVSKKHIAEWIDTESTHGDNESTRVC
ncbi:MAG: radical SAM protein [Spirochaetaceae bacterium]|nr:radical SAM protein [Spirochaetaceae bacterium]